MGALGNRMVPAGLRPWRREALLTLLLIASGAAALMHQTVWFRLLLPVLGVGVLSAAAVSAGALLGLALGALAGGWLADRSGRPGLVFGLAELVGGLLCAALPSAVHLLRWVAERMPVYGTRGAGATLGDACVLSAAVGVITLAAFPLGATLPAAVRLRGGPRATIGATFRRLYGWNTVGAVIGVALAVGGLIERLGNLGVVEVAALAQVTVGVVALVYFAQHREPAPEADPDPDRSPAPPTSALPACRGGRLRAAAFLAGGAGLAVQVGWVRRITPVVGNTTYAFATVLAAYLLALALGSLLLGPRRGRGPTRAPLRILVCASVPVALLPFAVAPVGAWCASQLVGAAPTQLELLGIQGAAAAMLLVPSTFLGAAALPWLLRAAEPETSRAGRSTGQLLFWNTTGSAVLALGTALWWLPWVGSAGVLRGAAGIYLGAAALLGSGARRVALGVLGAALLLQPLVRPIDDEALWAVVGSSFYPDEFDVDEAPRVFSAEGRMSTVVVRDREDRPELWVDAKIVASVSATDRLHLGLLGHLPMLLHPDPKRVAVIGLGTGITSTAVSRWHPQLLRVFELEPSVVDAARYFERWGGGVPAGAELVFRDGRQGIGRGGVHYDVVTSDPIHPSVAGSAALYGLDHYRALRAHADLVCQWLPLYQMTLADVRLVVRTFAAAFPYPYIFLAGPDALLVGTSEPLRVDEATLRRRLASSAAADLTLLGLRAPGRLLGLLVQGPDGARLFAEDGPLNTDDDLRLEFSCGRHAYVQQVAENASFLRLGREDSASLLRAPPSPAFQVEAAQAGQFHRAMRVWLDWDVERAVDEFDELLDALPGDAFAREMRDASIVALARQEFDAGLRDLAAARLRTLLDQPTLHPSTRLDAADVLLGAGLAAEARAVARPLADRFGWPRARRIGGR